jgi:TolB-like protein/Flp pilus assembly protein TadD
MSALDRAKEDDPEDGRRRVLLWPRRPAVRAAVVATAIGVLGATAFLVPDTVDSVFRDGAAAVQPARSVAVLPFVNQTGDPGNDYLSDGITAELIGQLARLPDLERVISRASVYTYKGRTVDPRTVAEDLNVGVVVTGAMARRDTNWALSIEVTDARDDRRLWGDTYELTLAELLAVSDRLALEIPRAMDLELTEGEPTPSAARTTRDPEAHRLYLRGLHLANQYTEQSMTQAIGYFEQALDREPGYALPYSSMAWLYGLLALFGLDEPEVFYPQAQRAARRALALDDQMAEAHMAMAVVHLFEWDWAGAEREYSLALQLDPHNAFVLNDFAAFLAMMDRHDEAIAMIEQARDLDPVSAVMNHQVAWTYQIAGQHERAVEEFERVLELFPNYGPAHMVLAWSLVKLGRQTEAVATAERAEQLSERDPWVLATMGYVYARAGEEQRARDNLAQLTSMAAKRRVDPHFMAIIHSGLGDTERALEWLERAYEARSPNLAFKSDGRLWFPDLVSDPRYQALRAQMNFPPD